MPIHNRKDILGRIVGGDIFYATSDDGLPLICLVELVTSTTIMVRTITTQLKFEFDRETGVGEWPASDIRPKAISCRIKSVAPLPIQIHDVFIGLDRKSRLENEMDRIKLNDAEKDALFFYRGHYEANPLPA
ncbi:hypothetical protein RMR16_004845 [Agrobacterium sp. rho-13.3]|jgi:hypothetical protein|uniref:hypothetical protein n=1 Tax=Agrobacterium sp. rho-13.3 TaxID=3072980 RepID=UPI002A170B0F|nr:hypothetical protein [Agrobacterium sp. rho-13.3]MDX8311751.1 hypothetical protein [Agrobacterium sp. rho-13.3]